MDMILILSNHLQKQHSKKLSVSLWCTLKKTQVCKKVEFEKFTNDAVAVLDQMAHAGSFKKREN